MSQTIKIDQLADTVMKGMEEYAKLAADDLKKDVKKAGDTVKKQIEGTAPKKTGKYSKSWAVHPDRGAFQEVSADASFGVWSCKTGRRKDKGFSAYRSCRTGGHRAADKGYRKGFTERRVTMTHEEVMQMLAELKIPFAYDHFAEGESPDPPFICFLFPGSENFAADDVVYMEFSNLSIELYTDEKDPELEDRVEAVLNAHEIFWNKSEVWIESEKLYEVLYQMTV